MADMVKGTQYRLRCSQPMPVETFGTFVLQTFKAEQTTVDVYLYTTELPTSVEFRGQGGGYMSANFSRLSDRGGDSFQGKIEYPPAYIQEDDSGFNNPFK